MTHGSRSRISRAAVLVAILLSATSAVAQLDEHCTVSIMNRTAQVQHDGSWVVENVPATMGPVRARAVCIENGVTRIGSSDFIDLQAGGSVNTVAIVFQAVPPIPASLSVTATETALAAAGATAQLTVTATMSDGATINVTAKSSGTVYRSSNPAVASVSVDGLVTARASGNVIVSATHEGTLALIRITVASVVDTDGDGMPDDYETANGFNPFDPNDGRTDYDFDGLSNLEEFRRGTDPTDWDTDGDGFADGLELQTGSDPLDPSSYNLRDTLRELSFNPRPTVDLVFEPLLGEGSRKVTVFGIISDGNAVNLTEGKGTAWSTLNPAIAAVTSGGQVIATGSGSTTLTASNLGISASEPINVTAFTPGLVGSLQLSGSPRAITSLDNYSFVATSSQTVSMIDTHIPAQPFVVASMFVSGYSGGSLVAQGSRLFVADSTGIAVVDISIPTNARVIGHYNIGEVRGLARMPNNLLAAVTPNSLLIVTMGSGFVSTSFSIPNARAVDVSAFNVIVLDGSAVLHVFDFSGGLSSVPRKSVQLAGGNVVRAWGDFAYVNSFAGLAIIDLIPSTPRIVSTLPMGGAVSQLFVRDGFVFAAQSTGTRIVDAGNETSPVQKLLLQQPTGPIAAVAATQRYVFDLQDVGGTTRLEIFQYIGMQESIFGFAPEVRITSPADGGTVVEGALLQVAIAASDDGIVDAVSLFVDNRLHHTTKQRPATLRYRVPSGATQIALHATATDFGSHTATSPVVTLAVVRDTTPPSVSITSPAATTVARGQVLDIVASATDDSSVASVEFFVNGASVGVDGTLPYHASYTVPATGDTLVLTATATDGVGNTTTSAPVTLTVVANQAPTISIIPPNTVGLYAGAELLVSVNASDDVRVSAVQFFVNGVNAHAFDSTPPFQGWVELPHGATTARLSAVAFDDDNHSTTSDEVVINLAPTSGLSLLPIAGFPAELVMQGTYGYIAATDGGLIVVDAANPAAPVVAGSLALPSKALALKVSGRYAFIVTQTTGLQVVDVADPQHPQVVATAAVDVQPSAIFLHGERAFVSTKGGVQVFDIRNPRAPQRGVFIPTPADVRQSLVSGNTLFVVYPFPRTLSTDCFDCTRVRAIDISNLAAPATLGDLKVDAEWYHDEPVRLEIDGNRLYVGGNSYITVVDVTDPRAMRDLGAFDNGPMGHCCFHDAKPLGGKLFVVGYDWSGVAIVDAGDPAEMSVIGQIVLYETSQNEFVGYSVVATPELVYSIGDSRVAKHFAVGRYATVNDTYGIAPQVSIARPLAGATMFEGQVAAIRVDATDDHGVASVRIAVDGQTVATLIAPPYTWFWDVPAGASQHVVTATATDFAGNTGTAVPVAFNVVADVAPPTVRISYPTAGASVPSLTTTLRAAVSDNFSVVSVTFTVNGVPMGVVTGAPYEITYTAPAGTTGYTVSATAVDQAGNTATASPVAVSIYTPQIIGSVTIPGHANQMTMSGNRLYIPANEQGMHVVDISNPSAPVYLGTSPVGYCYAVRVSGKYAYVALGGTGQMKVYDISNPTAPVLTGTAAGSGESVGLIGTHAYYGGSALRDYDVSNPFAPRFVTAGSPKNNRSAMRAVHGVHGRYALAVSYFDFGVGGQIEVYDTTQPLTLFPPLFFDMNTNGFSFASFFHDISVNGSFIAVAKENGLSLTTFTDGFGFAGNSRVITSPGFQTIAQHDDWLAAGQYDAGGAVLFDVSSRVTAVPRVNLDISPVAPTHWQKGIAMTPKLVVMATAEPGQSSSKIIIEAYRSFTDTAGAAPAVSLTTGPAYAGRLIHLSAVATDDVGVDTVTFNVNGVDVETDTAAPYETTHLIPAGTGSIVVTARARDFGGNVATSSRTLTVNPPPP